MENYDRNPFSVKIKKSGKSFGRVIKYRGKNSSGENFVNPSKFSSLSPDIFFPDKVYRICGISLLLNVLHKVAAFSIQAQDKTF